MVAEGDPGEAARAGEKVCIDDLNVSFNGKQIVCGASLRIPAGQTTALVGQSGSGKSTLALAACRLLPPGSASISGTVHVGGSEMLSLAGPELRLARSRTIAYLAQDASVALNPLMKVGSQIAETYRQRGGCSRREAKSRALQGFAEVGMRDPDRTYSLYPHQLSGGMRQRVMIAIALALRPALLVGDEPTTALDVTVQKEILDLIVRLQESYSLTVLWITHDLSVVTEIADNVAVMREGHIVEQGTTRRVFEEPAHDYTKSLLQNFHESRTREPKEHRVARMRAARLAGVPTATINIDDVDPALFDSNRKKL